MVSFQIVTQLIPGVGLIFVSGVYCGMRLMSELEKRNKLRKK